MKILTYYSAVLICLLCFSCKKEHNSTQPATANATKLYPVTFALSSFSQNVTNLNLHTGTSSSNVIKAASPSLKDTVDLLYYILYNPANNTIVRKLTQYSSAANFGTIKDSVAAGNYTVIIAGGKSGLQSYPVGDVRALSGNIYSSLTDLYFNYQPDSVALPTMYPWKDTFLKQFNVTIPTSSVQQVSLDRIVAQLQINITDTVPAKAAMVEAVISNDGANSNLSQGTGYTTSNFPYSPAYRVPVTAAQIGKPNLQLTTYTINYYTPFTVTINAYDNTGTRIASKNVSNVTCQKNMRTILTGKLFNGTPTVGFGVTTTNQTLTNTNRGF